MLGRWSSDGASSANTASAAARRSTPVSDQRAPCRWRSGRCWCRRGWLVRGASGGGVRPGRSPGVPGIVWRPGRGVRAARAIVGAVRRGGLRPRVSDPPSPSASGVHRPVLVDGGAPRGIRVGPFPTVRRDRPRRPGPRDVGRPGAHRDAPGPAHGGDGAIGMRSGRIRTPILESRDEETGRSATGSHRSARRTLVRSAGWGSTSRPGIMPRAS
jgi:hypothetical protein